MSCLIIDDNRSTADCLAMILEEFFELKCRVSYGSSAAITVLGSYTPDLILLDINMPGVDGTEILAYLRRESRFMTVPVIIVTSDDLPETRQRCMKGGAQAMILKPITIDKFKETLQNIGVLPE